MKKFTLLSAVLVAGMATAQVEMPTLNMEAHQVITTQSGGSSIPPSLLLVQITSSQAKAITSTTGLINSIRYTPFLFNLHKPPI